MMLSLARVLIILGAILLLAGILVYLAARFSLPLGRLPGDITFRGENFTCVFPLATSIILSIALTIILSVIARILTK